MKHFKEELEIIANTILDQNERARGDENKPNYTNREFMNIVIIFQNALTDKIWDNQEYDKMEFEERVKMAKHANSQLTKLIHTYTNLDITQHEKFI